MRSLILPTILLCACSSTSESRSEAQSGGARADAKPSEAGKAATPSIPFRKFVLDNGLELVVHEDHSNPVAAVYLYYHVGSAREVEGRSGFAHLFEHMLFQGSEHVGDDQHFKLVQAAGGTLNGSTTADRTNYFEVLPANQLELALWLESDRMGFLLPAMTQAKLDNQRDVVKNERRQNYENRPYGQADGVIAAALYPPSHPYSWITIGSQEDLTGASLDDVKGFFARWYGPNNATLAVGGDVKTDEVVALARKYFGSIPRGPEVETPAPRPTKLVAEKRLLMEDKVKLPELSFTWPTVPARAADEAALDLLASVLAANNSAILDKALKIDEQLASEVSASHRGRDLAGEFTITVRANAETTLDALEAKTRALLEKLAKDGVSPDQLERVKTRYETGTIRRQETIQQRTSTLANSNLFTKDPGFLDEDIRRHLAVTPADVKAVLERYVLGKPAVVLSVVPEGKKEMAAARSAADGKDLPSAVEFAWKDPRDRKIEPAPTSRVSGSVPGIDRTQKPAPGAATAFHAPKVWHAKLPDGVDVIGTPYTGVPMTTLTLTVPAGRLRETMDTLGLSSMTAELLQQGTRSRTATGFLEELDRLGATLNVSADDEEIGFTLSCLNKHLAEAVSLLSEVILHPRFADEDFQRVKKERLVSIDRRSDQIRVVAGNAYRRLLWGDGLAGMPTEGTRATIEKLSADAVRGFWKEHGVPSGARLVYVGGAGEEAVQKLFAPLAGDWKSGAGVAPVAMPMPRTIDGTKLYLVDKPGAAQSEIRIGHVSLASTDPDFYPLTVLNYPLGGLFSSRINMNLREDKGYTYGARSAVEGGRIPGAFTASAGVKTDVTEESVVEFMKELRRIKDGLTDAELAFTKDSLSQNATRQSESMRDLAGILDNVSRYGWPDDYVERRLRALSAFTAEDMKRQAEKQIRPDAMVVLVVGDKKRIAEKLPAAGLGAPIELDVDGVPLAPAAPATPTPAAAGSH
jgi:zinc protease